MTAPASPGDKPTLLIVDDDPDILEQMRWSLTDEYRVVEAGDRPTALAQQRTLDAPVVTLDMGLPPAPDGASEGLAALDEIMALNPATKVIVITGKSDPATALGAIERGAFDYLNKPVQLEELKVILRRAAHMHGLHAQLRATQSEAPVVEYEGMIGGSKPMRDVFTTIGRVAPSQVPVLILGESGTGKELAARAIHRRGPRKDGPFVAINCAAIPESLLESELFGHEKGSFTGATSQKVGRFETASGGTLFLDELGEMPQAIQVKLLRFLQDLRVVRVGGREEIPVDVRVIAATNRNLQMDMAEGRFREDLYYRLAIVTVALPALRERGDDVVLLAESLLDRYTKAEGRVLKGFSREATRAIQTNVWPGNVRQLENHIKRAVVMSEGPWVTADDLQLKAPAASELPADGSTLRAAREAMERELIERALARNKGNVSRTAIELGVSRPTLHELITKYQLKR